MHLINILKVLKKNIKILNNEMILKNIMLKMKIKIIN